jgi:hypothetical protein
MVQFILNKSELLNARSLTIPTSPGSFLIIYIYMVKCLMSVSGANQEIAIHCGRGLEITPAGVWCQQLRGDFTVNIDLGLARLFQLHSCHCALLIIVLVFQFSPQTPHQLENVLPQHDSLEHSRTVTASAVKLHPWRSLVRLAEWIYTLTTSLGQFPPGQ